MTPNQYFASSSGSISNTKAATTAFITSRFSLLQSLCFSSQPVEPIVTFNVCCLCCCYCCYFSRQFLLPDRQDADNPYTVACPPDSRVGSTVIEVPWLLLPSTGEWAFRRNKLQEKVTLAKVSSISIIGTYSHPLLCRYHIQTSECFEMRNCFHHRLLMTFFSILLIFFLISQLIAMFFASAAAFVGLHILVCMCDPLSLGRGIRGRELLFHPGWQFDRQNSLGRAARVVCWEEG